MQNAITTLRIQNFKSIMDVTLTPRRVNIIIGEPNVGKSNILEAMSLLGGISYGDSDKFMGDLLRYSQTRQIFYDNLSENTIKVETSRDVCLLGRSKKDKLFKYLLLERKLYEEQAKMPDFNSSVEFAFGDKDVSRLDDFSDFIKKKSNPLSRVAGYIYTEIDKDGFFGVNEKSKTMHAQASFFGKIPVMYYLFDKNVKMEPDDFRKNLRPPHGSNLITVIQYFPQLRKDIAGFFAPNGLKVKIRVDEHKLELEKDLDGFVYSYPYSSTADTLQRLIFYLAAIESNDDAVLLFEEPEAHSYPTYVAHLGQNIVESRNNQFFIVTHSPYLVTEILEEMLPNDELAPELAIFVAYYEDYQTKVRQLTDEEVIAVRSDGLDVFYNLARFVPGQME